MRQREKQASEHSLAHSALQHAQAATAPGAFGGAPSDTPQGFPSSSAVPARTPHPLERRKKSCCWAATEPQPQNRGFSHLQHQLLHYTVALAELQTYSFTCQAWISSYVRVELHVQYFPYFQRVFAICFYYGILWHRIPQTLQYLFLFCAAVMVAVLLYEQNDKTWSLLNSLLSTPIFFHSTLQKWKDFLQFALLWWEVIWKKVRNLSGNENATTRQILKIL